MIADAQKTMKKSAVEAENCLGELLGGMNLH